MTRRRGSRVGKARGPVRTRTQILPPSAYQPSVSDGGREERRRGRTRLQRRAAPPTNRRRRSRFRARRRLDRIPPGTEPRPHGDPRPNYAAPEGCSRTATPPRQQRRPREGGCAKSRLNRCRSFSRTSMPLLPSPALRPRSCAAHPGHSRAEAFIAYPRRLRCLERPVKGPWVIAVRRAPKDLAVIDFSARAGCVRNAAAPRLVQPLHHAPAQTCTDWVRSATRALNEM